MNWGYWLLGLLAGLGIPVQAAINARLGATLGAQPLMAALVSFSVGALTLGLVGLLVADWHAAQAGFGQMGLGDCWKFLGGVLGAFFVFVSIFLAPKIGVTAMVFLLIIGQLGMGMILDSFGLIGLPVQPLHWTKYAGLALMLAGVVVFNFGKTWFKS